MKIDFPIIQVVGYKNVGKTTLMEKLVAYFSESGRNVGTIKQHGHSGQLKTVPGTDSYRHSEAGANISTVKNENELQVTMKGSVKLELQQLIQMYALLEINFILIEGFKYADHPKIVLVKNKHDIHLVKELTNVVAVGVRDDQLLHAFDYFTFSMNQIEEELPKLVEQLYAEKIE